MADGTGDLVGFAYGEDLEQGSGRSLGYRLLAPPQPASWCAEVEALARHLQAAPYPDHWPARDLFCSVLLADGQRLVALARYGLSDHTQEQRRGGLELIGIVGSVDISVHEALAVYRWLLLRRAGEEDLHRLGGLSSLVEVLASAPLEGDGSPSAGLSPPVPVLPVRLWQDGAFLFAAGAPGDPDHHLRLLDLAGTPHWQWLPLVGPDFPLAIYAQRGPLVAWTPHLAGVAVKLERKQPVPSSPPVRKRSRRLPLVSVFLVLLLLGLLGGNLWYLRQIHQAILDAPPPGPPSTTAQVKPSQTAPKAEEDRDRFAQALYQMLIDKGGEREWKQDRANLLDRYAGLVRRRKDLTVAAGNERGKLAVAAMSVLAERSAERIEQSVRRGLMGKGFSDRLIKAACEHVREELTGEVRDPPGPP